MFITFIKAHPSNNLGVRLSHIGNAKLSHSDDMFTPNRPEPTMFETKEPKPKWYHQTTNWIKIALLLLFLSFLTIIFVYGNITLRIITMFLHWMQNNLLLGSLAFIGVYILFNLFMIPELLLTVGAGFTFVNAFESHSWSGIICAVIIVSCSRLLGATAAFLNGRYLSQYFSIRPWLMKYDKFVIMNEIIKLESFKVCLLLRLSPVTPYGLLNYAMALCTDVELKYFFCGNFGMIPDAITYCLIGASVASISELSSVHVSSNFTLLIISGVMSVVSFTGITYIGCVAKRELMRLSRIVENDLRPKILTCDSTNSDTIVDIEDIA